MRGQVERKAVSVHRTRIAGAAVIAMSLLASGCGSGGSAADSPSPSSPSGSRPSSTATLTILSPENGASVRGPTVHLRLSLKGARIVKRTSTDLTSDEGHVHVLLDGQLISMNYRLEDTIPEVESGSHRIEVEFVAVDHAPFDPRVTAVTSFEVSA
jgi:hypothetical protein